LGLFQDSTLATPAGEGDPVGGWQDQSGAGNHAIQVTQAKRPTLKRDPLTGRSLVWADGTDDGLSFANGAIPAGERTFLVVVTCRNTSGHIFSTGRGGATLGSFELRRDHIIIYDDAASAFNHTHNFGSGWRVESHVFRTTGSEHRKNGGSLFTTTRSATLSTIQAGLFGRSLAANGSNMDFPLAGDIGEFIVYNRALTTTERERVEVYLKDRWGTP
ncbi:MAG TPA: hypothetical protein VK689_17380, partial [Armatimonadota bacterium]|nr:hypothetical protein [Armatimonadota bacterium]